MPNIRPVASPHQTEAPSSCPVTPRPHTPTPSKAKEESPKDASTAKKRLSADFNPTNDKILFLGVNPSAAKKEAKALQKSAGKQNVTVIKDHSNGAVDGHDLKTKQGVHDFVKQLDLLPERQEKLSTLLLNTDPSSRDEFANIAKVWKHADEGGPVPSRMVLSGHSSGSEIFSEIGGGNSIQFDSLLSLADIFPKAACQVEDIHLSACNAGFKLNNDLFKEAFPNLKTFWGYAGTAPSIATHSEGHLKRWENKTRGRVDALDRQQTSQGLGLRGKNVAIWSAKKGYQADPKTLKPEQSDIDMYQKTQAYLNGDLSLPDDPYSGPVRDLYDQLQCRRGQMIDGTPEEQNFEGMVGRALKLRFYGRVSDNYQKVFGPAISKTFKSMGLPSPDFSKMSRKEALKTIGNFDSAAGKVKHKTPEMDRTRRLLNAFEDLSPALMGPGWVEPFSAKQAAAQRQSLQGKPSDESLTRYQLTDPDPDAFELNLDGL